MARSFNFYPGSSQHDFVVSCLRQSGFNAAADGIQMDRIAISQETYGFWNARENGAQQKWLLDVTLEYIG